MDLETFKSDIPLETAQAAYYGVSFNHERRGENARNDYAAMLLGDLEHFTQHAAKGGTADLVAGEFERYRAGLRKRYLAFLHSNARCVSWFIAGPSNFPAARMAKKSDVAHKRLNEMLYFRSRARAAIVRTLRADIKGAIHAGDADALERLDAEITAAETLQERMKATNATIRANFGKGREATIAALLALGFTELQAIKFIAPDCFGGMGYPSFRLTNNSANIRRMKARYAAISIARATPATSAQGSNARLDDCPSDNRVRLFFPGKPEEKTRTELKQNGFRWTPSLGCWQAYRNPHSMATARRVAGVDAKEAA